MGAVDLIPIYPLGEEVRVEDCAKEAQGEMPFVCVSALRNVSLSIGFLLYCICSLAFRAQSILESLVLYSVLHLLGTEMRMF